MQFTSLSFLAFFGAVFLLYWRLAHRGQNLFLLAASLAFYGFWNVTLIWLILLSATIDYLCGLGLQRVSPGKRRAVLLTSLIANLGLLGYFKYAGFFAESLVDLAAAIGLNVSRPTLDIVLPVGISFYTFQSMSYTIDIYRGELRACRNYLDFLLYVSFFPQLVAGPIERCSRLLPQLTRPRPRLKTGQAVMAIKLIVVGYVQKAVLGDSLVGFVDGAFSDPAAADSLTLLAAVYAFAIQIYCDFSGYSKIARGTAGLLGIRLMRNFEEPYLSSSITEFWRRWHISLSTWLRDYLYIPLGGNRRGRRRTYINLALTMLLGGLWHGASWNFVLWGGLHGAYLALHSVMGGPAARPGRLARVLGALGTFHLVCLAWIFFRAQGLEHALEVLRGLFQFTGTITPEIGEVLVLVVASIGLDLLLRRRSHGALLYLVSRNWIVETCAITALVLIALLVGENHVVPFVYFQF